MIKKVFTLIIISIFFNANLTKAQLKTGAENIIDNLSLLENKKVAVVANNTSMINKTHLIDSLISLKINIVKIFSPEHGFKGNFSAGAKVEGEKFNDNKIPLISLYGNNRKPTKKQLKGVDLVVFDIQDVGVRFYTYISTMTYVMEACAENNIPIIVLDRPNPNGFYVDGPVLEKKYSSFIGLHSVPVVYGMTIGEYALMVNEERWMKNEIKCNLKIVKLSNYNRNKIYNLSVHPSPNLQTTEAILLYPSLCFFEGTNVSIGRGTEHPFEIIGSPEFSKGSYSFIPKSIKGVADNPKYLGKKCNGYYLKEFANNYLRSYYHLYLFWLKGFYDDSKNKSEFFTSYFDKLAGSDKLRKQIIAGKTIEEIQKSWEEDLLEFLKIREKYLLYPDISIEGKLLRAK